MRHLFLLFILLGLSLPILCRRAEFSPYGDGDKPPGDKDSDDNIYAARAKRSAEKMEKVKIAPAFTTKTHGPIEDDDVSDGPSKFTMTHQNQNQDEDSDDMRDAKPGMRMVLKEFEKKFKEAFNQPEAVGSATIDFDKIKDLLPKKAQEKFGESLTKTTEIKTDSTETINTAAPVQDEKEVSNSKPAETASAQEEKPAIQNEKEVSNSRPTGTASAQEEEPAVVKPQAAQNNDL